MPPIPPDQISPFGLSIANAVRATGNSVSRTRLFELIKTGEVDARKIGRRTVVMTASLEAYLLRQPQVARTSRPVAP